MTSVPDVVLRPTRESDLRFVLAAERAPENAPFIRHWSEAEHSKALVDPGTAHWVAEETAIGAAVGYVLLLGLANPHRSVEFKRIVVIRGERGYESLIVMSILDSEYAAP